MGQLDFSTDDRWPCPRVGRRHLWAATKKDVRYCRENCRPVESSVLRSGSHFTRCISIIRTRRPGATADKKYKVVSNLEVCVSNFLLHFQSPTVYTPCLHVVSMPSLKSALGGLAAMVAFAYAATDYGTEEEMGPAAFMWPADRVWAASMDNTAPCGSVASPGNRSEFPMRMFSKSSIWSS